jgi:hypothetical protein
MVRKYPLPCQTMVINDPTAVGPLFLPPKFLSLPFVKQFPSVFANPFTISIAGTALGLLIGAMVVPS